MAPRRDKRPFPVWKALAWALLPLVLVALPAASFAVLKDGDLSPGGRGLGAAALPRAPFIPPDGCPRDACEAPGVPVTVTCKVVSAEEGPLSGAHCRFATREATVDRTTGRTGQASVELEAGAVGTVTATAINHYANSQEFTLRGPLSITLELRPIRDAEAPAEPDSERIPGPTPKDPEWAENGPEIPTPEPPEEPPEPCTFEDGEGPSPFRTHGFGSENANYTTLSWAALKTGERFAVAWGNDSAETRGMLRMKYDGGGWRYATENVERFNHTLVVNSMTPGRLLCFQVLTDSSQRDDPYAWSDDHYVYLENAWSGWDAARGSYTNNLLVLVNHPADRGVLEAGMRVFGERLRDMTDGWIQPGAMMVIYDNADIGAPEGSADPAGAAPGACIVQPEGSCETNIYDVTFTDTVPPGAAAYTYGDALGDPDGMIWMGPGTLASANEWGPVLAHEWGHYAFNAMDFYPAGAVPGGVVLNPALAVVIPDCDSIRPYSPYQEHPNNPGGTPGDPRTRISVMSASRLASELDDEVNRCPQLNEDWHTQTQHGYFPTWTLMRDPSRFANIPNRITLPDPGPTDAGDEYHFNGYDMGDLPPPVATPPI